MLVLPAKPPDPRDATCFEHRHHDRRATHLRGLGIPDRDQRLVGDALDEARAQRVGRDAEGPDVVLERDALDDVLVCSPRMNQRAPQGLEETTRDIEPTGPVLGDLARPAGHHVLVTFTATLGVVGRSETVDVALDFLEDEPVVVERAQRLYVFLVDGIERRALRIESVRTVVEPGRGFGVEVARSIPRAFDLRLARVLKSLGAVVGCGDRPRDEGRCNAGRQDGGPDPWLHDMAPGQLSCRGCGVVRAWAQVHSALPVTPTRQRMCSKARGR